jgi:hypothetical protein
MNREKTARILMYALTFFCTFLVGIAAIGFIFSSCTPVKSQEPPYKIELQKAPDGAQCYIIIAHHIGVVGGNCQ